MALEPSLVKSLLLDGTHSKASHDVLEGFAQKLKQGRPGVLKDVLYLLLGPGEVATSSQLEKGGDIKQAIIRARHRQEAWAQQWQAMGSGDSTHVEATTRMLWEAAEILEKAAKDNEEVMEGLILLLNKINTVREVNDSTGFDMSQRLATKAIVTAANLTAIGPTFGISLGVMAASKAITVGTDIYLSKRLGKLEQRNADTLEKLDQDVLRCDLIFARSLQENLKRGTDKNQALIAYVAAIENYIETAATMSKRAIVYGSEVSEIPSILSLHDTGKLLDEATMLVNLETTSPEDRRRFIEREQKRIQQELANLEAAEINLAKNIHAQQMVKLASGRVSSKSVSELAAYEKSGAELSERSFSSGSFNLLEKNGKAEKKASKPGLQESIEDLNLFADLIKARKSLLGQQLNAVSSLASNPEEQKRFDRPRPPTLAIPRVEMTATVSGSLSPTSSSPSKDSEPSTSSDGRPVSPLSPKTLDFIAERKLRTDLNVLGERKLHHRTAALELRQNKLSERMAQAEEIIRDCKQLGGDLAHLKTAPVAADEPGALIVRKAAIKNLQEKLSQKLEELTQFDNEKIFPKISKHQEKVTKRQKESDKEIGHHSLSEAAKYKEIADQYASLHRRLQQTKSAIESMGISPPIKSSTTNQSRLSSGESSPSKGTSSRDAYDKTQYDLSLSSRDRDRNWRMSLDALRDEDVKVRKPVRTSPVSKPTKKSFVERAKAFLNRQTPEVHYQERRKKAGPLRLLDKLIADKNRFKLLSEQEGGVPAIKYKKLQAAKEQALKSLAKFEFVIKVEGGSSKDPEDIMQARITKYAALQKKAISPTLKTNYGKLVTDYQSGINNYRAIKNWLNSPLPEPTVTSKEVSSPSAEASRVGFSSDETRPSSSRGLSMAGIMSGLGVSKPSAIPDLGFIDYGSDDEDDVLDQKQVPTLELNTDSDSSDDEQDLIQVKKSGRDSEVQQGKIASQSGMPAIQEKARDNHLLRAEPVPALELDTDSDSSDDEVEIPKAKAEEELIKVKVVGRESSVQKKSAKVTSRMEMPTIQEEDRDSHLPRAFTLS